MTTHHEPEMVSLPVRDMVRDITPTASIGGRQGLIRIVLPWPPTVNTYWRSVSGRTIISRKGRQYREAVKALVADQCGGATFDGPVSVDLHAHMPDRRRRDVDNLPKALLDALTHAGVLADDSQVDDLRVRRARDERGELVIRGYVVATIRPAGGVA